MGLGKSRCDILSGNTQGWACPIMLLIMTLFLVRNENRTNEMSTHCFEFVKLQFPFAHPTILYNFLSFLAFFSLASVIKYEDV
jgi:hypothetical protein